MALPAHQGWIAVTVRLLGEAVLCAGAMAVPFLLLNGYVAGVLSVGIGYAWSRVRNTPGIRKPPSRQRRKGDPLRPVDLIDRSAGAATLGIIAFCFVALTRWGYNVAEPNSFIAWLRWPGFEVPILAFLVSAGLFGLAVHRQRATRESRELAGDPVAVARTFAPYWLTSFSHLGLGFLFLTLAGTTTAIHSLYSDVSDSPAVWELFTRAPLLAMALPLAGLLAVAVTDKKTKPAQEPAAPFDDTVWRVKTAMRVVGFVPAVAATLYGLHLLVVPIAVTIPAFSTAIDAAVEIRQWVLARDADGASAADIAAELNRYGSESTVAAATGPLTLPDDEPRPLRVSVCRIRVQVGLADPDEIESLVRRLNPDRAASAEPGDADGAIRVKYCLKVSCPPLAVWEPEPMWAMYSSHPSEKPYWQHFLRTQMFFQGERLDAGGYCTADGELADSYQG